MRAKWGLSVVAFLVDTATLEIGAGILYLVSTMVSATAVPWLASVLPLGSAITVGTYHVGWAARTRWLSPGERFAGRAVRDGAKIWTNPYTRNRLPLFAVAGLTLGLIAHFMLGAIYVGIPMGVQDLLAPLGIWVLAVGSVLLAGRGYAGMLTLTSLYWLLGSLEELEYSRGPVVPGDVAPPLVASVVCLGLAGFYSMSKHVADSGESL